MKREKHLEKKIFEGSKNIHIYTDEEGKDEEKEMEPGAILKVAACNHRHSEDDNEP